MKRIRHIVEACENPVIVLTDHAATTVTATQTALISTSVDRLDNRLTQASRTLSQFRNLRVVYRPEREHISPNAHSRLPTCEEDAYEWNVLEVLLFSAGWWLCTADTALSDDATGTATSHNFTNHITMLEIDTAFRI